MTTIYQLNDLKVGVIKNRITQLCKTPYVADAVINGETVMVHTPALGCGGLCEPSCVILASPIEKKHAICSYTVELCVVYEPTDDKCIIIGTNPNLGKIIIDECFKKNRLPFLRTKEYGKRTIIEYIRSKKSEKEYMMFEYSGIDADDKPFVMEIQTVPCSNGNISHFPNDFAKKGNDKKSLKQLKQIQELTTFKLRSFYRRIMCYVIQRSDTEYFEPNIHNKDYYDAFYEAKRGGVEIYAIQINWNEMGEAILADNVIPIL